VARINLTPRRVEALKPDPTGKRVELRDSQVPGLVLRCAARRKTFCLHCRFPGSKNPTRRALGEYGVLTIDDARDIAREWLDCIRRGIDPAAERRRREDADRRAREAEQVADESRFRNVAEDYIKRRVSTQRRARATERVIRNVLVVHWGDKPISEITRRDVVRLVEHIDGTGAPIYAQAAFAYGRALFNWAIVRGCYNIEHSPFDRVRVGDLVSRRKEPRQRTLSDDELLCFWRATARLGYPWQQVFRLLLLTGTRRTECAGAKWSEFLDLDDPSKARWQIPAERFKSNAVHIVPLTAEALAVVVTIPKFQRGNHLFSFSFGETPALRLHLAKARLDVWMLRYLRALARLRGDDPAQVKLEPFVTHDLRRVLRSKLAALEITDSIAEACLGHGPRGLVARTYNTYSYQPQMRRALEAWAAELRRIVSPPRDDGKVVALPRGKRR
jgi:integrase